MLYAEVWKEGFIGADGTNQAGMWQKVKQEGLIRRMQGKERGPFLGKGRHLGIKWESESSMLGNSIVYRDLQSQNARERESKTLPFSYSKIKRLAEVLMMD